jgi:hypothetical protein
MGRAGFMQKPAQAQACGPLMITETTAVRPLNKSSPPTYKALPENFSDVVPTPGVHK